MNRASLRSGTTSDSPIYMQLDSPKEKEEKLKERGIFEEIMAKIFPGLIKTINPQIKSSAIPSTRNMKKAKVGYIIIKLFKTIGKENIYVLIN